MSIIAMLTVAVVIVKFFHLIKIKLLYPALHENLARKFLDLNSWYKKTGQKFAFFKINVFRYLLACTKPYYFDVADDSRVCYVEKDFLSKVICKKLHDEVQCLHYDVSK